LQFPWILLTYNQDGMDVTFNILTVINNTRTVFTHGQSVIGTYYHPGSKILTPPTVSRTDYPSVTTKLVPPPPRCDTNLGETSIHQIQLLTYKHSKLKATTGLSVY